MARAATRITRGLRVGTEPAEDRVRSNLNRVRVGPDHSSPSPSQGDRRFEPWSVQLVSLRSGPFRAVTRDRPGPRAYFKFIFLSPGPGK